VVPKTSVLRTVSERNSKWSLCKAAGQGTRLGVVDKAGIADFLDPGKGLGT
jgi:hypothetical protein